MNELKDHLNKNVMTIFPPTEEMTEAIASVYNRLRHAVRDGADTLVVTSTAFVWSKNDRQLGQFQILPKWAPIYWGALERIMEQDRVVSNHLQLIHQTSDEMTWHIKSD